MGTPARAQTEIQFWFAMTGALGDRVNALAERFNKEQSEYKVVPTFKGSYPEALSAAIAFAGGRGLVWTPVATLAGVVSLALFAYLGFVRGIRGPNAYGPDPLAD